MRAQRHRNCRLRKAQGLINIPTLRMSGTPEVIPMQPAVETVYISFSAEISPHTTESLLGLLANCVNERIKKVYLMLSTPGGSVMNGMNIYNVIRAMPFELITHNVGNVDSIGNAIFLAGSKRYACPHSTFMFHGVGLRHTKSHAPGRKESEGITRGDPQ